MPYLEPYTDQYFEENETLGGLIVPMVLLYMTMEVAKLMSAYHLGVPAWMLSIVLFWDITQSWVVYLIK